MVVRESEARPLEFLPAEAGAAGVALTCEDRKDSAMITWQT